MSRASLIRYIIFVVIWLSLPLLTTQRRSDYKRVLYHQDVHDKIQNDLQSHLLYFEEEKETEIVNRYQKFMKYKEQIKLHRLQPSKVKAYCNISNGKSCADLEVRQNFTNRVF